jgi:hypothetical protein
LGFCGDGVLKEEEIPCLVQPRQIGWVSSHLLKDLAVTLGGMRGQGHGELQKEGDRKTSKTGRLVCTTYFDSPFLALLAAAARFKV